MSPKNYLNKYLVLLTLLLSIGVWGQVTIFSENIGTGSGTQTIAATTFQNSGLVFSGSADTRTTSVSSGYAGASGGKNVFITNTTGTDFIISGIDTSAYTSIALTFGELKTATSTSGLLVAEVSTDGVSYTALSYARSDGAVWALISPTGTIPSTSNLRIRFRNPGTTHQFRIDDIVLKGIISCVAPTVSATTSAASVTTSTVNLTGNITNQGGGALNTRAFEYSTSSSLASSLTITQASTSTGSYTLGLASLTPNTKYYYRAYAINDCTTPQTGYSHTSAYPSFTTLSNAPATTAATAITTTGFQANWTAPTGGGSESFTYEIQIDNNNDFLTPEVSQAAIASTNLNYSTSALSSGTLYYYRVRTLNATGNSAWSNTTTVTTNTPAVPVVTSEIFNGAVGAAFSANITATNSPTSYSYTGTLPGGLSFSTSTGAITGTPTTATVSTINISVTATNGVGPSAPATISFNIAKGDQNITGLPTTQAKVYGDVDYTLSATASSALAVAYTSSDTTVATVTGNTISIKKVGTTTITASQAGDSNWNAATSATQTLTVTAKGLTISGLVGVDKVYDRTTTASVSGTPTYVGLVNGDTFTVSGSVTWSFADVNVGTGKTLTRTGNYNAPSTNYTVTQPTASANITKKALTISGAAASNKTYDTNTDAVVTGTLPDVISPDVVNLSGTGTFASANVGTGIVVSSTSTLTGANAGNYSLTQPTGLSANITKATPVFTTSTINVSAGGTYSLPGSISSTSDGVLSYSITSGGFATLSGTTINGIAVGSETLTVNQAASANYNAGSTTVSVAVTTISYVNGDYRTTGTGSWVSNNATPAIWERYDGTTSTWSTSNSPNVNTSNNIYIRSGNTITTGTSFANSVKIHVLDGGTFISQHNSTANTVHVYSGGTFEFTSNALQITTLFEIDDNGTFNFNYSANPGSGLSLWNGVENFHPNSNFVIKNHATGANNYFLPPAANLTANTYNGVTAYFGNLIFQAGAVRVTDTNLSGTTNYLTHKNLEFSSTAAQTLLYGNGTWVVGGDLKLNNTLAGNVTGTTTSTVNLNVKGNVINNSSFIFRLVSTTGTSTLNVDKDITLNSGSLDLNGASGGTGTVNLKGDLTVGSSASLIATNATTAAFNFNGTSTQAINVASVNTQNIAFNVNNGAYAQLSTQDFTLGNNSKLTVAAGGTLDFNFNGSTPLNLKGFGNTGTAFTSAAGSYLKISSPQGIVNTSGNVGNIQTTNAPAINALGTFHYVGKSNQVTGNGVGTSTNGRAVIVELADNTLTLTPSTAFGMSNAANANVNGGNGGVLDIRTGRFTETATEYVSGGSSSSNSATLKMAASTYYKVAKESGSGDSEYIPRFYTLNLTGGEIELASATNQTLRGGKTYYNLTFSNGGTKSISTATTDVTGTVNIKDSTILDASSNTFGGTGTNLTMSDTSKLILGTGTDPKPRMGGVYSLGNASTIEFAGSSSTLIRVSATTNPITYANVIVSGTDVKAGTTDAAGLTFQSGGTFTVKGAGVFKVTNPAGFSGGTVTAIKNTNSPAINLEAGSTVEYSGTTDQAITVGTVATPATGNYQNLSISGTGIKSPAAGVVVNNLTTVSGGTLKLLATAENVDANVLYAHKGIKNTAGNVVFENNAQLMQDTDAINSGNIESQRNVVDMNNVSTQMDYVYWSSPVDGQVIKGATGFSPNTPANGYLQYTESNDKFVVTGDSTFQAGKGYAIRAETGTNGYNKTYSFTGLPNNGDVQFQNLKWTNATHGYNLVGNPYPSNIDFDLLFTLNNTKMFSTAFFWTNNSYTAAQVGSGYNGNNYAVYNGTGGAPATYNPTNPYNGLIVPNGKIKVGQAFIVQTKSAGKDLPLDFNNTIRVTDKGGFFQKGISKNRFWLEMSSPNNLINTILIGYIPGATDDYETDFDGELFVVGSDSFYSVLGAKKLAIQGKSDNFSAQDIVPLGNVYSTTGNYTIKLKNPEGIFDNNQTVYLRDKLLNKYINLNNTESYSFAGTKGTDNTRFEIVYKENVVLGTGNDSKSDFIIYRDGNEFVIKSSKALGKIEVYDAAGRMVINQKTTEKILRLNVSTLTSGMFIVKAENSGDLKTKKILK